MSNEFRYSSWGSQISWSIWKRRLVIKQFVKSVSLWSVISWCGHVAGLIGQCTFNNGLIRNRIDFYLIFIWFSFVFIPENPLIITKCDINSEDGSFDGDDTAIGTYHLKEDPNLHISFQFHTYSSSGGHHSTNHLNHSLTSSTKRNAHFGQITNPSNRGSNWNKDHSSYASSLSHASRHKEMHKTLEKNRRAHLRECFELLKSELPLDEYNEKKTSHINIIRCAIRYINQLKSKDSEHNDEISRLKRIRGRLQESFAEISKDLLAVKK